MAKSKQKPMTAAELMASLAKDKEYQAKVSERDARIEAADRAHREEERPLIQALADAGVRVASVWDLVNSAAPYPRAVPVLLEHLGRPYSDKVMEGIARSLAVPEAKAGWRQLVAEFEKRSDQDTLGVKWALACALSAAGHDGVLDDVVNLLRDKRHGQNRLPLLEVLARSKTSSARTVLEEMTSEPDLAKEATRRSQERIAGRSAAGVAPRE